MQVAARPGKGAINRLGGGVSAPRSHSPWRTAPIFAPGTVQFHIVSGVRNKELCPWGLLGAGEEEEEREAAPEFPGWEGRR